MNDDPYAVLGLGRDANATDVKQAFRDLAKKFHPDLNPHADAYAFQRISRAADSILNKRPYASDAAAAAEAARRQWRPDNVIRHSRAPIYFSFASIICGCLIFAGAIHVHKNMYTYNVHEEVEARRRFPTPGQQRIMQLLQARAATKGLEGGKPEQKFEV